jgi:hypothetical protein
LNSINGSPQWQTAFLLITGAWILINATRGWAIGLLRQIAGVAAFCVASYCVVKLTGRMQEFLRPHFPAPILTGLSVLLIWVVSFNLVSLIGRLLFKRTGDYDSSLFRFIYGSGGAALGAAYALLVVFVFCLSVRLVGRIAADQVEAQEANNQPAPTIALNLVKLKNSLELGWVGPLVSALDPIPDRWYHQLDQYSRLSFNSEAIRKQSELPGSSPAGEETASEKH